jgi:hypothetical protein
LSGDLEFLLRGLKFYYKLGVTLIFYYETFRPLSHHPAGEMIHRERSQGTQKERDVTLAQV